MLAQPPPCFWSCHHWKLPTGADDGTTPDAGVDIWKLSGLPVNPTWSPVVGFVAVTVIVPPGLVVTEVPPPKERPPPLPLPCNASFIAVDAAFEISLTALLTAVNDRFSWHAITPVWKGLRWFWQAKCVLFSLVQKRMCWLCGWQVSTHPVFCSRDIKLVCNGKQSGHGNVVVLATHF